MEPHLKALTHSKYVPLWLDQPDRPDPLEELRGEQRCELLIVGGGYTGMWAALQARERHPELDVILIEATEIGDGASGRNGGFLSCSLTHGSTNADVHFPGEKDALYELGRQNLKEFVETLERHQIDARYEPVGSLTVTTRPEQNEGKAEWVEAQREAGKDLVWFDREAIQEEIHSPTYLGGVWYREQRDGLVDPASLCWGLKKAILALGVRIFEATPLLSMDRCFDGMKVECPNGTIRCQKVLMGTNAFRNPIPRARRSVIPVWDYVVATEPLTPEQLQQIGWQRRQGLSNEANMFHYYRLTHDNRIVWGGGGNVCYYYGSRTDAGVADPPDRFAKLSSEFFETFPQLAGIRFSHRWSGIIASTTRFCMAPGVAYDGRVSWAIGYTGLGVGATRFGARIGLELLGYDRTPVVDMGFVRKRAVAWPPEPARWLAVTLTRNEMGRADRNRGRRGLWLRLLDRFNLGFAC